ncbi:hypothetical protein CPB85DRAFT_1253762 [Mucidula mucida]|nr:hypothetical protein CPB85DRAFT_1253762 [Mucidula mucida]
MMDKSTSKQANTNPDSNTDLSSTPPAPSWPPTGFVRVTYVFSLSLIFLYIGIIILSECPLTVSLFPNLIPTAVTQVLTLVLVSLTGNSFPATFCVYILFLCSIYTFAFFLVVIITEERESGSRKGAITSVLEGFLCDVGTFIIAAGLSLRRAAEWMKLRSEIMLAEEQRRHDEYAHELSSALPSYVNTRSANPDIDRSRPIAQTYRDHSALYDSGQLSSSWRFGKVAIHRRWDMHEKPPEHRTQNDLEAHTETVQILHTRGVFFRHWPPPREAMI